MRKKGESLVGYKINNFWCYKMKNVTEGQSLVLLRFVETTPYR